MDSFSARCRAHSSGFREEGLERVQGLDTRALLRSWTCESMLKGPLVSAPSEPAPVVEGDLPVPGERCLLVTFQEVGD